MSDNCNESLVVSIESKEQDWTFMYGLVTDVAINLGNSPSSHPIPYGTTITDNMMRNMDTISIDGVLGCLKCDGMRGQSYTSNALSYVISKLKTLSQRMVYDNTGFVTLTSTQWLAKYMIMTSVSIRQKQDNVQKLYITTEWVGANLVGTIGSPVFIRGGIVE